MTQLGPDDPTPPAHTEPAEADASSSVQPEPQSKASPRASASDASAAKRKSPLWWWVLGIACVLGVELFVYGHNGWVRVCVGLEGVTDLTLIDRPKHRDGMKGFPICAEQLNLGMYSRSGDAAQEALEQACSRGAPLLHGIKQECLRKEHGWVRRVDKSNIMPWDERLYRRLFFLD